MHQHKGSGGARDQADCEANVTTRPLQACRQRAGDGEAIVEIGELFEVRRFTRDEHARGETAGWRFDGRWHRRASGLEWAWFQREISDGAT